MSTTWLDFKQLRRDVPIADVLRHYSVDLKVTGAQGSGFCPLPTHDGGRSAGRKRSPSFSVNLAKNIWQCFGCGASGNVLDLACRLEGLNPDDGQQVRKVALKLVRALGLNGDADDHQIVEHKPDRAHRPPRQAERPQAKWGRDRTQKPAAPATNEEGQALEKPALAEVVGVDHLKGDRSERDSTASRLVINGKLDFTLKQLDVEHPYMTERGLVPATIAAFGLGVASRGLMKHRLAIPIHDEAGDLIAYAGRIVDDTLIDEKTPKYLLPAPRERDGVRYEFRKSLVLYNLHRLKRPVDDLVVVEGYASVWSLHQSGYHNVVALMGSACSTEQLQLIVEATAPAGTVWLMPDGDDAGERCAHDLLVRLASHRTVRWLKLGTGEQPTDLDQNELDAIFNAGNHPERR
jgi:DNA primase